MKPHYKTILNFFIFIFASSAIAAMVFDIFPNLFKIIISGEVLLVFISLFYVNYTYRKNRALARIEWLYSQIKNLEEFKSSYFQIQFSSVRYPVRLEFVENPIIVLNEKWIYKMTAVQRKFIIRWLVYFTYVSHFNKSTQLVAAYFADKKALGDCLTDKRSKKQLREFIFGNMLMCELGDSFSGDRARQVQQMLFRFSI